MSLDSAPGDDSKLSYSSRRSGHGRFYRFCAAEPRLLRARAAAKIAVLGSGRPTRTGTTVWYVPAKKTYSVNHKKVLRRLN